MLAYIFEGKLIKSLNKFSSNYNLNTNYTNIQQLKLEILIKIIIYLNFMELFLNLIVKLTNEGFYLGGINDKNTCNVLENIKYSYEVYSFRRAGW